MTTEQSIQSFRETHNALRTEIGKVIVGHDPIVEGTLIALLAGGHVLLEGVPGLGKTLLVRTLSEVLDISFNRIQFTPDLMPADILGTNIVMEVPGGRREFQFQKGPIFAHLVLADEINRATPKTQSALLEAMQEHSVTAGGEIRRLAEPFFVMATHPRTDTAAPVASQYLRFGSSPRGGQTLILAGKVRALTQGRFNVSFDDIQAATPAALRHRLILNFEAEAEGITTDHIIDQILKDVPRDAVAVG